MEIRYYLCHRGEEELLFTDKASGIHPEFKSRVLWNEEVYKVKNYCVVFNGNTAEYIDVALDYVDCDKEWWE